MEPGKHSSASTLWQRFADVAKAEFVAGCQALAGTGGKVSIPHRAAEGKGLSGSRVAHVDKEHLWAGREERIRVGCHRLLLLPGRG